MSPGLSLRERVVAEPQLFHGAVAEVLGEDVGVAHHAQQDLASARVLEVDRDAALVAVHHQERRRDAVDARLAVAARIVAARQLLDLDHVRAHVGQHHAAGRPGHDLRQLEHAHARERAGMRRSSLGVHCAAELRLGLGEERRVADAEVLGVEAVEALVVFVVRERPAFGEPAGELLVPAGDQRRAVGDALAPSPAPPRRPRHRERRA